MNLPLKLTEISCKNPSQTALVYRGQSLSYIQLNTFINQFASSLMDLGILPGDRILLALGNCPEFIISYYAIMRVRAISVPVNHQYTLSEFRRIMHDASPVLVITTESKIPIFDKLLQEMPNPKGLIIIRDFEENENTYSFNSLVKHDSWNFKPKGDYQRDEIIVFMYTSGNNSTQKGVMLTHHNLYTNASTFAQMHGLGPQDKLLLVAPVFHIATQTCIINAAFISGATLVVQDGWISPDQFLQTVQDQNITFYFGPPTMYSLLVQHQNIEQYDLSSWRIACTGTTALPAETFHQFEKKFGLQITESYGLTETSPLVASNLPQGLKKPGSVGLPIPGVEVKIVDYDDSEVTPGNIGEIIVRGPNVMKGYYNREEETKLTLRNSWLHTGDFAYCDRDGYLYIMDKKKDVIIRGGFHIYPKEVEEVLYTHPYVFEVAVLGVPDPNMGEEVLAFVLLRNETKIAPEELQAFCRDKIAMYKIPKYIRVVDNIPKTTSGKLLKGALREMI